jgi:hypothetical protein
MAPIPKAAAAHVAKHVFVKNSFRIPVQKNLNYTFVAEECGIDVEVRRAGRVLHIQPF